ncbi:MAG: amidohydrolase [Pseudomonadota bacterium]
MSTPDLILVNANVITLEPEHPLASLIAIRDAKVLYVGDSSDLKEIRGSKSRVIDCTGKTILPGFNDAHCHFFALTESFTSCNFTPKEVRSISDIQEKIRNFAQGLPSGTWVKVRAYDEFYLKEKRHPTYRDLDKATSAHPVKLSHRSGNAHVLNSLAMATVGISNETPEPPGAIIDRDLTTGKPNGILFGMGPHLSGIIPYINVNDEYSGVKQAIQQLLSLGITSIQDASSQNDINNWGLLQRWKTLGILKCRVKMMLGFEAFKSYKETSFSHSLGVDQLGISGVKILLNEATGSLHPPQEELNEMVLEIHQAGFQVAIHAIEEPTVEAACSAIEYALLKSPRSDHRHRIEHCSVCPPKLAKRIASLGIIVSTQPSFIYYNGDRYLRTVSSQQLRHLYPMATLLKNGIRILAGSDFPVVPPNTIISIYSAVSRISETGETVLQEEGVSSLDALRMHTEYPAMANFEENIKGTITPGKVADLVILNGDPLKVPAEEIKDIQVEMTVLNGEVVWEKQVN